MEPDLEFEEPEAVGLTFEDPRAIPSRNALTNMLYAKLMKLAEFPNRWAKLHEYGGQNSAYSARKSLIKKLNENGLTARYEFAVRRSEYDAKGKGVADSGSILYARYTRPTRSSGT